jgi:hypothetical protein
MKKIKIPIYLQKIISNNKQITSGRKNFLEHHKRIIKNIELIKKFLKNKSL